jgi:hypothetical protein
VGLTTLPPSVQCEIFSISQPYRPPRPVTEIVLIYSFIALLHSCLAFGVITAVVMNITIFWYIALSSPYVRRSFGEMYHLNLQEFGLETCCMLVSCSAHIRRWRWKWYVTSKRPITYGLHGAISRQMATLISVVCKSCFILEESVHIKTECVRIFLDLYILNVISDLIHLFRLMYEDLYCKWQCSALNSQMV